MRERAASRNSRQPAKKNNPKTICKQTQEFREAIDKQRKEKKSKGFVLKALYKWRRK